MTTKRRRGRVSGLTKKLPRNVGTADEKPRQELQVRRPCASDEGALRSARGGGELGAWGTSRSGVGTARGRATDCEECDPCPHGRVRRFCADCNPCPHRKLKKLCVDCSGCSHGKRKDNCVDCNLCPHGKHKRRCADCNPCPHGRLKNDCADCNRCPHEKHKYKCAACKAARAGHPTPPEVKPEPDIKPDIKPRGQA